jgi:DNA-binding CsgD family transcriptional regulator
MPHALVLGKDSGLSQAAAVEAMRRNSTGLRTNRLAPAPRLIDPHSDRRSDCENGLLVAQLRKADLLYQVDALKAATDCLVDIAKSGSDNVKVRALTRLSQIECDLGHSDVAQEHLAYALTCAERRGVALSENAKGELLAAQCWNAISDGSTADFETLMGQLWALAANSQKNDQLWSLVAGASIYASGYQYSRQDIKATLASYERAATALRCARDVPPFVLARALTVRAALDMHKPERVHLACSENANIYALSLEHGMVGSACDALHNILIFSLYCDESWQDIGENSFAREIIDDADAPSIYANEAMLTAAVAATLGRFDDAINLIGRARTGYQGEMFAWSPEFWNPAFTTFEARLLYKASRFDEAERAAAEAAKQWDRAGLGRGAALRVRAEALEALGRRDEALATINEALEALESFSPVHHLLGAYACAYRLTKQRSYLEPFDYLKHAVRRAPPAGVVSTEVASSSAKRRASRALTARERDVALLVADGHTNPEIARRLGIGRKTVANHVAAIFDRLDLRARWQITHEILHYC